MSRTSNREPFDLLDEMNGCRTIGISGHIRPDGDCVGSCMAAALYLEKAMPQARVDVFLDEYPEALRRHIAGSEQILPRKATDVESYDAFLVCDCECTRTGDVLEIFKKAKKHLNIDHHETNPGTGEVCYVVPEASSACELVYHTLREEMIDERIARNLYIGMVTDTGVFAYSNTSRKTMEIAGRLMEYGFDFSAIVREVFYEKTRVQQQMLGYALMNSELYLDGRCLFSRIDRHVIAEYHAGSKDMDGIAAELVHTYGVCCVVFMYEIAPGRHKLSLRSTGEADVSKICAAIGGGGHARASGATVDMSYEEIAGRLLPLIEEQLAAGVRV